MLKKNKTKGKLYKFWQRHEKHRKGPKPGCVPLTGLNKRFFMEMVIQQHVKKRDKD
jgi:hypothetical protein